VNKRCRIVKVPGPTVVRLVSNVRISERWHMLRNCQSVSFIAPTSVRDQRSQDAQRRE